MYKSRDSSRSGGGGGGSSSRSSGSDSHRSSSGSRFSGGGGDRRGPGGGDRGRGGPPPKRGDELNSMRIDKPNFANMELRSFQKEFYRESTSAAGRAQNDLTNLYREFNVVVNHVGSSRTLRPVLEFNELTECVPRAILDRMRDCNYDRPTTIQSFCWPTLLSGLNMVGVAQTGSGKTLGFLLPMLVHIYNNERYVKSFGRDALPGPVGLVLAPTRELAQQIQEVAENFGRVIGINNIVIYGGAAKGPQMGQMRRGADIYIATPGRLLDFLKENVISLQKCSFLVLDEADRMLDMGFEPQIRKIIEQIRPDRQTAMFSATWPKEVRKLAEDFIWNYAHISIGTTVLTANPNIRQHVEVVDDEQKEQRLRQVLGEIMNERDSKAIVFAETKRRVDAISVFIKKLGFYCLTIHGDKKQQEREWVLSEFKQKPKCILVATDVAARGLNIEDIKYVINVDYPQQTEDYVHRIGRTARNSNAGTSYTFLTRQNARHASALVDVLRETNQQISDELLSLCGGRGGHFNRNGGGLGGKFRNGPSSAPSGPHAGPRYGGNRPNESNNNSRPSYSNGTNPSINNRGESNGYNGYNNHTNGGSQEYGRKPAQQYGPPAPALKRDYSDLSESNGGSQNGGGYPYETRSHDPKRQRTSNNRWEDNNTSPTKFNPAAPPPSLSVPPPSRFAGGYQNGHNGAASAAPAAAPGYNGFESDLLASFKLAPPPPPPTGAPANVPPVGLPLTARPPPQAIYQGYQAYY